MNKLANSLRCLGALLRISIVMVYLSACLPTTPPPPLPRSTPTDTLTPTSTVVWFPPTATNTPNPTIAYSPTPEFKPGIGAVILEDGFNSPNHWLTGDMGKGTIALGLNELSLALTQSKGYLFSFRDEPTFDDFYAEITASPSLCTGQDEYGMLIRYNSPVDFYRFSLSCDGQTRLDKLYSGIASSPQPWLKTSSVPSAAPSSSRISVWAVGSEMRFFINGGFQFSVNDRMLPRGMIGVFVRSGGDTAVTVHFSDLVVYLVQQ